MKASDLFVKALENEGVDRIFAVPGEENLDVVESLRRSRIELVLTRHEQSAAFMAATHGRLTGRPGVCMATLGPGALNLVTGAAYAHLGAMPMVLITGQKAIMSARQARFQIVDIVATMKPLTKASRQIISAASIPTVVRDCLPAWPPRAARVRFISSCRRTSQPKRWPTTRRVVAVHPVEIAVAPAAAIERAAEMLSRAQRPLVMLGAATSRTAAHRPAHRVHPAPGHPVLQHPDGQGHRRRIGTGRRRHRALDGHRRADRARLRATRPIDRAGPDPRDRPRHDREAALHHGSRRVLR
jgi:acetolactate synthase-1/2/3 large subunit